MKFLKDNRLFFSLFLFWEIFLLFFIWIFPKGQEFLMLQEIQNEVLDSFFKMITFLGDWPAYLLALFYLYPKFKIKGLLIVCSLSILVPISSHLSKTYFKHPRPSLFFKNKSEFKDVHKIEGVKLHEGFTSFPSGHTLSAFSVLSLLAFYTKKKWMTTLLFLMVAIFVGISRVYLLQHFVEDIMMGAFLGVFLAFLIYYFANFNKEPESASTSG
jgi:membrane-associated phospholipid phosphatase